MICVHLMYVYKIGLTQEAHNLWRYFADNFVPKGTFSTKFLRCTIMLASIKSYCMLNEYQMII